MLSSYGEFFPGHPGNVIIEEGAMQTEVFVVISGELEVHAKQDDGNETLLARIGPGETLGEISLFDPGPAAATVTAVEFSQLWRIADADLMEFMQENPGAGNLLLRTLASILAQRLRQMNPKAFGLSTYAVIDSPELKEGTSLARTSKPSSHRRNRNMSGGSGRKLQEVPAIAYNRKKLADQDPGRARSRCRSRASLKKLPVPSSFRVTHGSTCHSLLFRQALI